ncbi:hypothetical protein IID20_01875 [Patescibacteria group bacterium]|nr:hypothetical protein [Patescibacteria group bacterium]
MMGSIASLLLGLMMMILTIVWKLLSPIPNLLTHLLPFSFPGLSLLIMVGFIFIFGLTLNLWQNRSGPFAQLLSRIPVIGKIIGLPASIKTMTQKGKIVLIKLAPNLYITATTSETSIQAINEAAGQDLIGLGVTSFPFIGTGSCIVWTTRENIITPQNMPIQDWATLIMSGSLLNPKTRVEVKSVHKKNIN